MEGLELCSIAFHARQSTIEDLQSDCFLDSAKRTYQ